MLIKSSIETKLDAEIQTALEELKNHDKTSDAYGQLVERIAKLHKLKIEEEFKLPSLDTALVVAANIFGILWLARYERENVIKAPKAFGNIMRPR